MDRSSNEPVSRQVYARLRGMILAGELSPSTRLGSTRRMARDLGVSRNTVMEAFGMLRAEGFLTMRVGDGSYVTSVASFMARPAAEQGPPLPHADHPSHRFDAIDFRSGIPDTERFPRRAWKRLGRAVWDSLTPLDLAYSQPEGRIELRRQIASRLSARRDMDCHPDQVLITTGGYQGLEIAARLLVRPDRPTCLVEDPSQPEIPRILSSVGGRVEPVAVDGQGLVTEGLAAEEAGPDGPPALVYVTPFHQYPLGVSMPLRRKLQLLDHARRNSSYIVEHDGDSDLGFDPHPPSSLRGMDPARVILVASFSSTLFPALRMGYLVLPHDLVAAGRDLKWSLDRANPTVDQLVLARFMAEGLYERHLREMRSAYSERRGLLVETLKRHFGDAVTVPGTGAGMHLCACFSDVAFTFKILNRIILAGVGVYPVEECALRKGRWMHALALGYGMLDARRISTGIAILKRCMPS